MTKPGIKEFHKYIKEVLRKEILGLYESFHILSEADLQGHVWQILSKFFEKNESERGVHQVLNKPFFKELNIHPDIVIFRHGKPWITIELKERKTLKLKTANKEFDRLIETKKHFISKHGYKIKRGYLLYVARRGTKKKVIKRKGEGARFFYEIPIVLQQDWSLDKIKTWEKEFAERAKYAPKP